MIDRKELKTSLILLAVFIGLGLWRWKATGHVFYILNFGYIGLSIFTGGVISAVSMGEKRSEEGV